MNSTCTNRNRTSEKWIELCKQERNRSRKRQNQPRPQGLLAFQYGGGSGECPGT